MAVPKKKITRRVKRLKLNNRSNKALFNNSYKMRYKFFSNEENNTYFIIK